MTSDDDEEAWILETLTNLIEINQLIDSHFTT